MVNILIRFIFLTSLIKECSLGKNTFSSTRNVNTNLLGDIETDFLKIFSDIKQIRSNVPNSGATNVTFEPERAHTLLQEPTNYKRTNIINPRDELRDKMDSEFLNMPFASDMLMDFQTRNNDPQHRKHGVGEGLASLPETNDADDGEHLLISAFSKLNKKATIQSNEENDINNKSTTSAVLDDSLLKVEKIPTANNTADKVNTSNNMTIESNSTVIHNETSESKNKNTSHVLAGPNDEKTNNTNEISDKLVNNNDKVSVNGTTSTNQTSGLKDLELQINSILNNVTNTNKDNETSRSNISKRPSVAERNMIFEAKIKGFLAKLDTFKFSDIGSQEKEEGELKLQKHETASPNSRNEISHISNNTSLDANSSTTASKLPNNSISSLNEENKTKVTDTKGESSERTSRLLHLPSLQDGNKDLISSPIKTAIVGKKKDTIDATFEPECSDKKKCPANKYCRHFECFDCHHKHHECVAHEQCCDGMPCIYGRCDQKATSSPGSICKNDGDCGNGCCVLEPTINIETGICKIKLAEYHQCSPVLYRKVWIGDKKPSCGPCEDHLECVNKGVIATHLVCTKKAK